MYRVRVILRTACSSPLRPLSLIADGCIDLFFFSSFSLSAAVATKRTSASKLNENSFNAFLPEFSLSLIPYPLSPAKSTRVAKTDRVNRPVGLELCQFFQSLTLAVFSLFPTVIIIIASQTLHGSMTIVCSGSPSTGYWPTVPRPSLPTYPAFLRRKPNK